MFIKLTGIGISSVITSLYVAPESIAAMIRTTDDGGTEITVIKQHNGAYYHVQETPEAILQLIAAQSTAGVPAPSRRSPPGTPPGSVLAGNW